MEPEEITNIEIYRLKFILKRQVFVLNVTSVNTVQLVLTRFFVHEEEPRQVSYLRHEPECYM